MTQLHPQGKRSELKKVGDPYRNGSKSRNAYYTKIKFIIDNKNIDIAMKVDTGAAHTVIGFKHPQIERYIKRIQESEIDGTAYDASGDELPLKGYIVENFELTEDIKIPRLLIFFSEKIKDKAILGMDILSLFDFQYLREKRSTNGSFWINNYEDVLDTLKNRMLNKDIDYVDPGLIMSVDDVDDKTDYRDRFTIQDAGAAYITKRIKEEL